MVGTPSARLDHNGAILGIWANSGSQARLGGRLGWLQGDFRRKDGPNLAPKMGPTWSRNDTKIDAKIGSILEAFENQLLMEF